jgi:hypothetical protein
MVKNRMAEKKSKDLAGKGSTQTQNKYLIANPQKAQSQQKRPKIT